METKFTILSHACLLLERGDTKIIIDPWLVGACYWGSWWNFPEPKLNKELLSQVDYVIISHVHWDHWHGLSLKSYFKNCHYIVPDEYQGRSYNDLKQLKLGPITLAKQARTLSLPDSIKITCYQFGLFLNDSAIAVETPECKILDVNDCKITGLPLKHIMNRHGHFDFALRSHSSANYRACINSGDDFKPDDPEHYARAFKLFMQKLQPTYAIPFASNSCHLHKDTQHFNRLVTNPLVLQQQIGTQPFKNTELKIMLPGSSWSSKSGFNTKSTDCFNHVEDEIKAYQRRRHKTLDKLYARERAIVINQRICDKHCAHLQTIPKLFRKGLKRHTIAYAIRTIDNDTTYYQVQLDPVKLISCDKTTYTNSQVRIEWPTQVFRDSVLKNMYHHAFISKRVLFYIPNQKQSHALQSLINSLERIELGVYPLRLSYFYRMFRSYCIRYRELIVYFAAFYYAKIRMMPLYLVEERITNASLKKD